jgi:hypothetical protein
MTTLAAAAVRRFELLGYNTIGAVASDIIYEGALVGENGAGYGRPLVAGDIPVGFAVDTVDNSAGAAGAKNIVLRTRDRVALTISGVAITDIGKPVYASDDDTFTLTESTNSFVGRITRYIAANTAEVEFDFGRGAAGLLTPVSLGAQAAGQSSTTALAAYTFTATFVAQAIHTIAEKLNSALKMQK